MKEKKFRQLYSDIIFFFLSFFGGIVVGMSSGAIGSFLYIIILFPIIMGATMGNIFSKNMKYTKTRNKQFLLITSMVSVVGLYIAFHYIRYVALWFTTSIQVFGDLSDKSLEAAKVIIEYAIKDATNHSGFIGYMLFKAQQGVSIGRFFSSNKFNLGPIFTWIYWLIEIGIIGYITNNAGKKILEEPFCEYCRSWYSEKKHIGGVPIAREKEIMNFITQKDFTRAGTMLEENSESPSLELYLQSCSSCDKNQSFLSISLVEFLNGKLISKEISETILMANEKESLLEGIGFRK